MANTKHQDDAPVLPPVEQLRKHTYEKVRPSRAEGDSAWQDGRGTLRRRDGSVTDWLHACGHLSDREWAASVRLRQDAQLAGIEARVVGSYEQTIPGGKGNVSDARMDARDRWQAAMRAVGQAVASVLIEMVLCDIPPSDWAADAYGYSGRSASPAGMSVLRLSLSSLADFYGLDK